MKLIPEEAKEAAGELVRALREFGYTSATVYWLGGQEFGVTAYDEDGASATWSGGQDEGLS